MGICQAMHQGVKMKKVGGFHRKQMEPQQKYEKPFKDAEFRNIYNEEIYTCDLFWDKSKVAYFTEDNEEAYLMAKEHSVWQCFYSGDLSLQIKNLLSAIEEN